MAIIQTRHALDRIGKFEPTLGIELQTPIPGVGNFTLNDERIVRAKVPEAKAVTRGSQTLFLRKGTLKRIVLTHRSLVDHVLIPVRHRTLNTGGCVGNLCGKVFSRYSGQMVRPIKTFDCERGRLFFGPIEVVLTNRAHNSAFRNLQPTWFGAVASEKELELIALANPKIGTVVLGERAPLFLMHKAGPHCKDELFAGMHPAADSIALGGIDASVTVSVIGVWAAPLSNQIVLAHKEGSGSIRITDRPAQPTQHLFGHVVVTLGAHASIGRKWFGH